MTNREEILPYRATHPGVLIKDELEARGGYKQKDLAKELGVKASFLNEVIKGRRPVTADLAILLEKALEIPAEYWMKFQSQYEIDRARIKEKNIARLNNIEVWKVIKEIVPVSYFKKLGYLSDDLESDIQVVKGIYGVDKVDDLMATYARSKVSFYRRSSKLKIDDKNMFAWSSLARYEAQKQQVMPYRVHNEGSLFERLNRVFYENRDTVAAAQEVLVDNGIKFVLIPKLEKTPVDGYSFWSEDNPAIAMTLRHSRIDNFAFTLLHELAHVSLHIDSGRERSFIDLTTDRKDDIQEKEADMFAQEKLIPEDCWSEIKASNFKLNDDNILSVGEKYQINPAIILGCICYENKKWACKTKIDRRLRASASRSQGE